MENDMRFPTHVRRWTGACVGWGLRRVIHWSLAYPAMRRWLINHLSNVLAMNEASFSRVVPAHQGKIEGFEDCYWLFTSNKLSHGVSRLRLDQATFLWRLLRSMSDPQVVELGRYKGGTTLLLAAAGAKVLSIDNDSLPGQRQWVIELEEVLKRFGFQERVQIVVDDALSYPVNKERYDLVFIDFAISRQLAKASFEHWLPGAKRGGYILFGDGNNPDLPEVAQYVADCIREAGVKRVDIDAGPFVLLQKE